MAEHLLRWKKPYLNPNFKARLVHSQAARANGRYTLEVATDINFTGMHAECRALNDLSIKKFGHLYVQPKIYDDWLKNVFAYNRNIISNGIMHPFADCFYLTDLVTFIH